MSLFPYIVSEPEDWQVTPAERLIYKALIDTLTKDKTSMTHAIIRTAARFDVSRTRVMEIYRKVNSPYLDIKEPPHA